MITQRRHTVKTDMRRLPKGRLDKSHLQQLGHLYYWAAYGRDYSATDYIQYMRLGLKDIRKKVNLWIAGGISLFQTVHQGLCLIRRPIYFPPMCIYISIQMNHGYVGVSPDS